MPIVVLCFTVRKPGTTFQDYKSYYELHHSKNVRGYLGDDYPATYTRHYVERSSDGDSSHISANGTPAAFLTGSAAEFTYDCVTIMTWQDQEAYERMVTKFADPEVVRQFVADEEMFIDRPKTVLMSLGEVPRTPPKGQAM